jgi:hypothetical protein
MTIVIKMKDSHTLIDGEDGVHNIQCWRGKQHLVITVLSSGFELLVIGE